MPAARNIELKARLPDLAQARTIAQRLATAYLGIEQQIDTFFHCHHGRLKLREITGSDLPPKAQLIPYSRADQPAAKASDYQLVEVADAAALKQALAMALGIQSVVTKQREIFLYHNVRIHLDEVSGLGTFIEFEAVLGTGHDEAEGQSRLAALQRQFAIQPEDLISGAYADLLEPPHCK